MAVVKSGKGSTLKKKRDGFVFNDTKIDNALYEFIYEKIPFGRRRDELKRLILLGFIAETGYSLNENDIIPVSSVPKPVNVEEILGKLFNVEKRKKNIKLNNKPLISEDHAGNNSFNDIKKCIRVVSIKLYDVIGELER